MYQQKQNDTSKKSSLFRSLLSVIFLRNIASLDLGRCLSRSAGLGSLLRSFFLLLFLFTFAILVFVSRGTIFFAGSVFLFAFSSGGRLSFLGGGRTWGRLGLDVVYEVKEARDGGMKLHWMQSKYTPSASGFSSSPSSDSYSASSSLPSLPSLSSPPLSPPTSESSYLFIL